MAPMKGYPMNLHDLASYDLIYLASPYSKYPTGIEQAFEDISRIAARLLVKGLKVYSPIAHTHPIAMHGNLDAFDHSIWLPFDQAIMKACSAMAVATMETWEQSFGIGEEIKFFKLATKPIFYIDPETLAVTQ